MERDPIQLLSLCEQTTLLKMKQIYTIAACTFLALNAMGQTCSPDPSYTAPGFYPPPGGHVRDTVLVMPVAELPGPYSEVIQFVIPADTTIVFGGNPVTVSIDSMRVHSAIGLPVGFTYSCDNSGCSWEGGENGCMGLYSSPTITAAKDVYLMEFEVVGYTYLSPFGTLSDTSSIYVEVVVDDAVGIQENLLTSLNVSPNPMTSTSEIQFNASGGQNMVVEVMDITGRVIYRTQSTTVPGSNAVKLVRDNWPEGMYLYRLTVGSDQHAGRLIVRDGL